MYVGLVYMQNIERGIYRNGKEMENIPNNLFYPWE